MSKDRRINPIKLDDVKKLLGEPIVDVELTQEQYEIICDQALKQAKNWMDEEILRQCEKTWVSTLDKVLRGKQCLRLD